MTSSSRRSRRDAARRGAARRADHGSSRPGWLLPAAAGAIVIVVAVVAIILGGGGLPGPSVASSPLASPGSVPGSAAADTTPTIAGPSLPKFDVPTADAAVGLAAPIVRGASFDGRPVTIGGTGRPTVVLFLAHWCSHCQAEVPRVQAWLDAGGLPEGVDLMSVATATDPNLPNYPPDAWLAREGWTPAVLVDPTGSVAEAYGLSAFPYFVFVDGAGNVTGRLTGELPVEDLERIASDLASGG